MKDYVTCFYSNFLPLFLYKYHKDHLTLNVFNVYEY